MKISTKIIERMCRMFSHLDILSKENKPYVSSKELAFALGATDYTIRKDLSFLGIIGYGRKGYEVLGLKRELAKKFHLGHKHRACIIGLGRLGTALLDYEKFQEEGFEIVAGFDKSTNKIERIRTNIDVYTIDRLKPIIKERNIELGIIAVPAAFAQEVADNLVESGIKGILNFSPAKLIVPKDIMYQDMDFTNALRFIAACFATQAKP
ncbi:MAG: redox-sensing transcriptional repressor Rex [Candidatus Omnitrophica bacterium]|nr:redox-sensing transcriptional repressor Rex [Candidatus Omnitrophota bacterium]